MAIDVIYTCYVIFNLQLLKIKVYFDKCQFVFYFICCHFSNENRYM
jgi:hypothetical protein